MVGQHVLRSDLYVAYIFIYSRLRPGCSLRSPLMHHLYKAYLDDRFLAMREGDTSFLSPLLVVILSLCDFIFFYLSYIVQV